MSRAEVTHCAWRITMAGGAGVDAREGARAGLVLLRVLSRDERRCETRRTARDTIDCGLGPLHRPGKALAEALRSPFRMRAAHWFKIEDDACEPRDRVIGWS